MISSAFGWISIIFWFFTYYPQIRLNFLLRRSKAVSPFLIVLWLFGDSCNMISSFLIENLLTSKVMAIIFVPFYILLLSQYFVYRNYFKSLSTKFSVAEIAVYLLIFSLTFVNLFWSYLFQSK
jgi:uncharacterized protein with PQ loop repeat